MKTKATIVALFILLLSFTVAGLVQAQRGAVIEVTTDKYVYAPGESVGIIATNIGDQPAIIPSCSEDWYAVNMADSGAEVKLKVPIICDGFFMLEPGQSIKTTWDQAFELWDWNYQRVFPDGEQVPSGTYTVEWHGDTAGFVISGNYPGPVKVETDKKTYSLGETVTITTTNLLKKDIWITCPFEDYTIYDEKGGKVYFYPMNTCKAMTRPLAPGESVTVTWDQTYLVWEPNPPYFPVTVKPTGEQVPAGKYSVFMYGGVDVFKVRSH